jgi:hypothetical protein
MLQWLFLRSLFALYQLLAYLSTSSNSKTLFAEESYKGRRTVPVTQNAWCRSSAGTLDVG